MKIINKFLILIFLFAGVWSVARADTLEINMTVQDDNGIIFSGSVAMESGGTVEINDTGGSPHAIASDSVLAVLSTADAISESFNISNLTYYDSFGAFYLKCIESGGAEQCDGWQFKVNGSYANNGMDQEILSGGEEVEVFFGSDDTEEATSIDEEVVEPEPEPEPEPESKPIKTNGPSGYMLINPTSTPEPILVTDTTPTVVKEEVQVITPPAPVSKPSQVSVKPVVQSNETKINPPATLDPLINTANVINADIPKQNNLLISGVIFGVLVLLAYLRFAKKL